MEVYTEQNPGFPSRHLHCLNGEHVFREVTYNRTKSRNESYFSPCFPTGDSPSVWNPVQAKGQPRKHVTEHDKRGSVSVIPSDPRDNISTARLRRAVSSFYSTHLTLMPTAIPSNFVFPSLVLLNIVLFLQDFFYCLQLFLCFIRILFFLNPSDRSPSPSFILIKQNRS